MKRLMKAIKNTLPALAAGLFLAAGAQARDQLYWSVDVAAPVAYGGAVRSSWSNSPRVQVVEAPPVYVQVPTPVYVERPWYPHRAGFFRHRPVVIAYPGHHHHGHHRHHHHDGWRDRGGNHGYSYDRGRDRSDDREHEYRGYGYGLD